MRIDLSMLSADKRRRKREVVGDFEVHDAKDVSEHEAVHELQEARRDHDDSALELAQAKLAHDCAEIRLTNARRAVRRVSER